MYIAKKYLETNKGQFKKGETVPDDIAVRYIRDVEIVDVIVETTPDIKEELELLVEAPSEVEVEVEEVKVKKGFFSRK